MHKYIPYNPKLKSIASKLRQDQTSSEIKLWNFLKKSLPDFTFNRQKPLDEFIADFYCSKLGLIIEVDGEIHDKQIERDRERDNYFLYKYNIKTVRITNVEIENDVNSVRQKLSKHFPSLIKEG